jgi:LCP family protein required for cell wall assembly
VLVVVATGTTYLGFAHYAGKLLRLDNVFPSDRERPAGSAGGSENFLLVGSDNRDQLTKAEQRRYHLGHDAGRRSDTMIILHVSKHRDRAVLVSLPRDSYVEIPAYTDTHGVHHPAQHNKLNAAYSFGGPRLTIATVERATGIRIDHYVEINVLGFARMVDALGGIDVCVPTAVNDPKSGLHLPAGHSHVGGVQGLAFVRARKTLGDGSDLGRIKRQQQFLGAMLRKALSLGILLDPAKLDHFLNAALAAVHVDRKLSAGDLRTLALTMRHLDPHHVTFVTVPLANTDYRPGNVGSTVLWNRGTASALFAAINRDAPVNAATFKRHKPTVAPSHVSVTVLNGTRTGGLAGQVSAQLAAEGFHTGTPGNADNSDYAHTVIRYAAGQAAAAATVKAALPDASLQQVGSGSGLVVVVGRSFTGVEPVSVAAGGTKPTIPTSTAADNPCKG